MGNEIFTINDMDLDKSKYNNKTIYAVNHNIISNGKDIKTIVISYIYHYDTDTIDSKMGVFDIHLISYKPLDIDTVIGYDISYKKEIINIDYTFLHNIGLTNDLLCDLVFDELLNSISYDEFISRATRAANILNNIEDIKYMTNEYNRYMGVYAKDYIKYIKSEKQNTYLTGRYPEKFFKTKKYAIIKYRFRHLFSGDIHINDFVDVYYGYDSNYIYTNEPSSSSYDFIYVDILIKTKLPHISKNDINLWFNKNKDTIINYSISIVKQFYVSRFKINNHNISILLLDGLISVIISRIRAENREFDFLNKDDDNFIINYIDYKSGKISGKEAARRCHVVYRTFIKYVNKYEKLYSSMEEYNKYDMMD